MRLMLPVTASTSLRRRSMTPHRYRSPRADDAVGCGLRDRGQNLPGGDKTFPVGTKPSRWGQNLPGGDKACPVGAFDAVGCGLRGRGQNLPGGDKTFPVGTIDAVGCGNPVPAGVGCPWPGRTVPGRAECPRPEWSVPGRTEFPRPGPVSARGGPGRPVSAGVGRRRGARSRPVLIGMMSTGRSTGLKRLGNAARSAQFSSYQ